MTSAFDLAAFIFSLIRSLTERSAKPALDVDGAGGKLRGGRGEAAGGGSAMRGRLRSSARRGSGSPRGSGGLQAGLRGWQGGGEARQGPN